jgi:hypothetical protein
MTAIDDRRLVTGINGALRILVALASRIENN